MQSVAHPSDSLQRPCVVSQMHKSLPHRFHGSWTQLASTQRLAVPTWTAHDRFSINSSRASLASADLQSRSPLLSHRYSLLRHPQRQVAASAALAHSTSAGDAEEGEDSMPGELHAVDTAIRANMLIFAAKLAVYFISSSRWAKQQPLPGAAAVYTLGAGRASRCTPGGLVLTASSSSQHVYVFGGRTCLTQAALTV